MTERHEPPHTTDATPKPTRIDRRGFFRGAAALTVGGIGATTGLAQTTSQSETAARADAARDLEEQTARALRWGGRDPADWVRARSGVDHNVVIVGGGQSGLSIAYGLRRKGVGPRRGHRSSRAGRGRHLAHDRAHASTAHAEDDGGTGARQRRRSPFAPGTKR